MRTTSSYRPSEEFSIEEFRARRLKIPNPISPKLGLMWPVWSPLIILFQLPGVTTASFLPSSSGTCSWLPLQPPCVCLHFLFYSGRKHSLAACHFTPAMSGTFVPVTKSRIWPAPTRSSPRSPQLLGLASLCSCAPVSSPVSQGNPVFKQKA